jgi:hypothetical protein
LQGKHVAHLAVIVFRPEVSARGGVDELGVDSNTVIGLANAAFEYVSYAKLFRDLLNLVLAGLTSASGATVIDTESSDPDVVKCLGYSTPSGNALWAANIIDEETRVAITDADVVSSLAILDEALFLEAVVNPEALPNNACPLREISELSLGPYAVALIRWPMRKESLKRTCP